MFPRLPARRLCTRIFYIAVCTCAFVFVSYQFGTVHSDAKAIPPAVRQKTPLEPEEPNPGRLPPIRVLPIQRKDEEPVDISDEKPIRGDVPEETEQKIVAQLPAQISGLVYIQNEKYPKLNEKGRFIPQRRIIHLDLKGAAYKVEFFTELFPFFKRLGATGVLLEWEDMFPYTGTLTDAKHGDAYSMADVETILKEAQKHRLEIIPLVQTFGHLEWALKLEKFAHLREDKRYPQVICFPLEEAWTLLQDMIDQVAAVHQKFGMPFFHMGADEAFQVGFCNASVSKMNQLGSKERLMLWHMARTAQYIKTKYQTTVLAWHDMIVQVMEADLIKFNITTLLEPVLWSYAEDLDMYLPRSTWMALKPFRKVWGSSAWKGADGPGRYNSNPQHYIKNHESWVDQMSRVYEDFEVMQGLIMTGWSRYDHLATICELLPVGVPAMAMGMETILEATQLRSYPKTEELLQCNPPTDMGFISGCRFPGSKVYELINDYYTRSRSLREYRTKDFELNGWLSREAEHQSVSSHWYIEKVLPMVQYYASQMRSMEKSLRHEMAKIYFQNTIDEFIYVYMGEDIEWLNRMLKTAERINAIDNFPKRPMSFPKTEL